MKLGKVVYVITPHLHTKFQISTLLLCQNIPVDVIFYVKRSKIHDILVCKLYTYGAIDLKLGKFVYLIT